MRKLLVLLVIASFVVSGCTIHVYKSTPKDKAKIGELSSEVERLKHLREEEAKQFEEMKKELQKKLKGKAGLDIGDRGLVITLADDILFDSGKANIKESAYPTLNDIAQIIKTKAPDKNIGIEGHTDNVPIKYSGWKSNRELSTARANNVYHYMVDKGGLSPAKLTTMGYGEYNPVSSNDTKEDRKKNRRVEIVILPEFQKQKATQKSGERTDFEAMTESGGMIEADEAQDAGEEFTK